MPDVKPKTLKNKLGWLLVQCFCKARGQLVDGDPGNHSKTKLIGCTGKLQAGNAPWRVLLLTVV